MFRNKIFIFVLLVCSILLFAQPMRLSEKIDPITKFGLSSEYLESSKTRAPDSLNCTLVGRWPMGPFFPVAVADSFAYIGCGFGMKVLNVKDSTNPFLVGDIGLPAPAFELWVRDTLAFIADCHAGLQIINISNPSSPVKVGFHDTPGYCMDLWIQDTLVYAADYYGGLRIINISDPSSPFEIGFYDVFDDAYGVCIRDSFAYVAYYTNYLRIINISDPSTPVEVGVYDSLSYTYDIYVQDTLAYLSGGNADIVNVSDPSAPSKISSLPGVTTSVEVLIRNTLAYVAAGDSLKIFEVSDPSSPIRVGSCSRSSTDTPRDIYLKNDLIYLTDRWRGLFIIDVSNPSTPNQIGFHNTGGRANTVKVKDSLAYVIGDDLNIINVSTLAEPVKIGHDTLDYGEDLWIGDTLLYVADGNSGLRIVNIADPTSPIHINTYDTPGWASGILVMDSLAYVADGDSGLRIINVSDPTTPSEIGFYDSTLGYAYRVLTQDTLAYVADINGLRIINVSNPVSMSEVGSSPGSFTDIYINDTIAYTLSSNLLHIFDISDPSSPNQIYSFNTFGNYFSGIWGQDDLIFIADGDSGLRVIAAFDSIPSETGFYTTYAFVDDGPFASDVCFKDSFAYVAYGYAGLSIIKYTGPYSGIEEPTSEKTQFNISKISSNIEINYSVVNNEEKVKIEIFNILGQKVACPIDEMKARGNYTLNWSGKTGIYFVRLEMGGKVYKQKTLLLR